LEIKKRDEDATDLASELSKLKLENKSKGLKVVSEEVVEMSTKIRYLMSQLKDIKSNHPQDKSVIFSEWTSALDYVGNCLELSKFLYVRIDGQINNKKQKEAMQLFQEDKKHYSFFNFS